MKSVNYIGFIPYSIEALKEMDIKLSGITTLDVTNPLSVGSLIRTFLSDVNNQIGDVYARVVHSDKVQTKELCASDGTCLSDAEFRTLIQEFKNSHQAPSTPAPVQSPDPVPDNGSPAQVSDPVPAVVPAPDPASGL